MEGPGVKLIAERMQKFVGKRVLESDGNTKSFPKTVLKGQTLKSVSSVGKNLFLEFSETLVKIHFMMWGSHSIDTQREGKDPRLKLTFSNGIFFTYNSSIKIIDQETRNLYKSEIDILSPDFAKAKALKQTITSDHLICDIIMDQTIYAGVGNIIKNEGLYLAKIHPLSVGKRIPRSRLNKLIIHLIEFSNIFYEVRKEGRWLRSHMKIYGKKQCETCDGKVKMQIAGTRKRRSYFCSTCQKIYG